MPIPRRTRIINSSRIIRELWIHNVLSKAELAKNLNMNKSSVSNIIEELITYSVVEEKVPILPGPKGGRTAMGLSLNKDWFYVLGFELRSDSYTVLAVDIQGNVLFSQTEQRELTRDNLAKDFIAIVKDLQEKLAFLNRPLLGIGVGFSGIVDRDNQIIIRSVSLDIHDPLDFKKKVAGAFDFPVILENDASCGAWGEVVFQREKQLKNFIFLLIEFWKRSPSDKETSHPTIGIGFGFGGRIYHGSKWAAGEFKSVLNRKQGSSRQIEIELPHGTKHITEDNSSLRLYIRDLCTNIAFLVNTLDIGNIFIGGDTEPFQSYIITLLEEELRLNSLTNSVPDCHIQFSSLGYHAVAYGAAALSLDQIFMNLEPLDSANEAHLRPLYFMEDGS